MHLLSATNTPTKSNNLYLPSPSPVKQDKCLSRDPPRAILPPVVTAGSVGAATRTWPELSFLDGMAEASPGSGVGGRGGAGFQGTLVNVSADELFILLLARKIRSSLAV